MILFERKGYRARLTSIDEDSLHGEVMGINDVVTFQGSSVKQFQKAFNDSVDDYLEFCKERGEEPEKPYSGRFIVRMEPNLHRKVSLAAEAENMSLNAWVAARLTEQ